MVSYILRWAYPTAALLFVCFSGFQISSLGHVETLSTSLAASRHAKHHFTPIVNTTRERCVNVIQRQKDLLTDVFTQALDGVKDAVIVGIPYHENKGDSAIFVAEMQLLSSLGITVHYVCSAHPAKLCSSARIKEIMKTVGKEHFAILYHGGGNFGDLYPVEHGIRIAMMKEIPHARCHMFPQSIKFSDSSKIAATAKVLAGLTHPRNTLAFRDHKSHEIAITHFEMPNMRISLTPDIVFFMGFRPDLRRLLRPKDANDRHDILYFKRGDEEKTDWAWIGSNPAERIETLHSTLEDVNRRDRSHTKVHLSSETGDWLTNEVLSAAQMNDSYTYQSWKRFRMGASWLAQADYIVLDRLHGHIVSTILGIPHILIDNSIGKLGDYHATWTSECPLGQLIQTNGTQKMLGRAEDIYGQWIAEGRVNGADFEK